MNKICRSNQNGEIYLAIQVSGGGEVRALSRMNQQLIQRWGQKELGSHEACRGVDVCAGMYVNTYMFMYVHACVCMHAPMCLCVHMHVCVYVCVCLCVHVFVCPLCIHVHAYICMCLCVCVRT